MSIHIWPYIKIFHLNTRLTTCKYSRGNKRIHSWIARKWKIAPRWFLLTFFFNIVSWNDWTLCALLEHRIEIKWMKEIALVFQKMGFHDIGSSSFIQLYRLINDASSTGNKRVHSWISWKWKIPPHSYLFCFLPYSSDKW